MTRSFQFLGCSFLLLMASTIPVQASEAPDRFASFVKTFKLPPQQAKPTIRYWLPGANVDPAVIRRDMTAIAKAGFGAIEIADLPQNAGKVDPVRFGWATPAWRSVMVTTAQAAIDAGMRFSLTIGPAWPIVLPTITPDSAAAAKELVFGSQKVPGGSTVNITVPAPHQEPAPDVHERRLVAIQAWRCSALCQENGPVLIQRGTYQNLAANIRDGKLSWQAPREGLWIVIAFWERGTGQTSTLATVPANLPPTEPQSYVPDHFGPLGAKAIEDHWNTQVCTPELRALIHKGGYSMFEDSLELASALNWTPSLPREFSARRGYALEPLLPLILVDEQRSFTAPRTRKPHFTFAGEATQISQVYSDYQRTLSDLYRDNHLRPLKTWVNSLGLAYRVQTYGLPMDIGAAATIPDVPEGENLTLNNELDDFRMLATGGHISGATFLSTECCSGMGQSYRQTWADMLATLNIHHAGGVNQVTVHGYPYSGTVATAQWPGWSPFEPFGPSSFSPDVDNGFSEAWGPRQPSWPDMPFITGLLARTQAVLQHGEPEIDVALVNDQLDHNGPTLTDQTLRKAGYSYGFVSSAELHKYPPQFRDGYILIGHAHFRALLLGAGSVLTPQLLDGVKRLQDDGGLVLLVGEQASNGLPVAHDLREAVTALQNHQVTPSITASSLADLLSVHRRDRDTDYYWLFNRGKVGFDQAVELEGAANAYVLSPWSGETRKLTAKPGLRPGTMQLRVRLDPGATIIVALTTEDATLPGLKTAQAGTGSTGSSILLKDWTLQVEAWRPESGGRTFAVLPAIRLEQLKPWSRIKELADVSGRGTYTTGLDLPFGQGGQEAVLSLPAITDVWRLSINGQDVPVDQWARQIPIGSFLKSGQNRIRIDVATTLNNSVRLVQTVAFRKLGRQDYGLSGPVSILFGTP